MSAATTQASGTQKAPPAHFGEWFWRFLAFVMIFVIGWVAWIAIQISPPDMILPAAYEAAAKGRASRNSAGPITGSTVVVPDQATTAPPVQAPAEGSPAVAGQPPAPAAPATPTEPPVNVEKLRMAESIDTPIPDRTRRAAKPAAEKQ